MIARARSLPLPAEPSPELLEALLRNDPYAFSVKAFPQVHPGYPYLANWHHKAICYHLMQVLEGKINRLIINVPPRSLKSYLTAISFVAFVLGREPWKNIVCVSYSQELSNKHARECRALMETPFYRELFPDTKLNPRRTTECDFMTTQRGGRLATSVGGTLTGRGGDIIIIDDPIKPADAASERMREATIEWADHTLMSRLNDKRKGAIIVVMQRLHDDDLSGHFLRRGNWVHLKIPAVAQREIEALRFGTNAYHVRKKGDLLHPELEPIEVLEELRRSIGSANFSAQYLQEPVPADSDYLKWGWFKTFPVPIRLVANDEIWQSWDTAIKADELNDYSVCITVLVRGSSYFILDVYRARHDYPTLKQQIVRRAELFGGKSVRVLIEDKGSGSSLIQDLRHDRQVSPIAFEPEGDKVLRLVSQTAVIERGDVYLPASAPWLDEFRKELLQFPNSKHDDQVDALSQFLNHMTNRGRNMPFVMDLDEFMGRFRFTL
jgi:predicted phage terminase large subunit-like protein